MNTTLIEQAQDKVALTRLSTGQLSFHRYTFLAGIRFLVEVSGENDVTHFSLDEWARAFLGTAAKRTREIAKGQIRRFIPGVIDEGLLVVPEYEGRELAGFVWVRNIPDDDADGIADMVADRIAKAERQSDAKQQRLDQLKTIYQDVVRPPAQQETGHE